MAIKEVEGRIVHANTAKNGTGIFDTYINEEVAELIKEIAKKQRGVGVRDNLVEELSDVLYVLSMYRQVHGITDEEVNEHIRQKEARALSHMGML